MESKTIMHSGSNPHGSELSQRDLEELLSQLHPDRTQAGERYLRLRDKLVSYFEFEKLNHAEELADEVIDRVARRLNEGERIERLNAYSLGVARLLTLEARQKGIQTDRRLREFVRISSEPVSQNEPALACLDQCLAKLPTEGKALILEYYSGDRGGRIESRKRMALRLGLDPAALRNRALRLRESLEVCMKRCLRSQSRRAESGL